jgi:hypothetical protein
MLDASFEVLLEYCYRPSCTVEQLIAQRIGLAARSVHGVSGSHAA